MFKTGLVVKIPLKLVKIQLDILFNRAILAVWKSTSAWDARTGSLVFSALALLCACCYY